MTNAEKLTLAKHACHIRMGVIEGTHSAKCGHPGGSLDIAELLSYLYFVEMNIDPKAPKMADRDRLVLSKGHAAPALYAALAERGYFPVEDLKTLRKIGSYLQGHPNMNETPGVDMSTGSLGQGVSAACGMALGAKHAGKPINVYTILADCEVQAIRLGGGSASIINGSDLDHLLRLIRSCYHVAEDAPVTMRTCPADINGANMPFYNRSHVTRYDLELYSLEPLDFCTLDTLNYSEQMPYITHGFLRADRRDSMGFVLLYGKKTVSRWGFRHSVLEVTRRPVCHVLLQRCAGADMLDDAAAQAQLDEAAQLLTEAGFVQYLPRRWAKPGCEDKFWQSAANGMDVLAFGLSAYTRLDGMITANTSDLNTYLAHSADYEQITVSTVPAQPEE